MRVGGRVREWRDGMEMAMETEMGDEGAKKRRRVFFLSSHSSFRSRTSHALSPFAHLRMPPASACLGRPLVVVDGPPRGRSTPPPPQLRSANAARSPWMQAPASSPRAVAAAVATPTRPPTLSAVDESGALTLSNVRRALIRQEDTIVFCLIERAQVREELGEREKQGARAWGPSRPLPFLRAPANYGTRPAPVLAAGD